MPLRAGDKLDPYEILAPIGAGGMGEVYRARDSRLNRDVAIKISAAQFSERFEREAKAIAALNHPNICHLYDVGPNYLVMEYIEGESPRGPLPLDEALRIARQITDALEAAHEKGITHRDLKPANIRVKPNGTVKVLDFGLAKIGGAPATQDENSPTLSMAATQAGVILGTAAYMAPEQARGKPVDRRADIWAFGVVFYELLTGKRLFQGEDLTDTLARVVRDQTDLSPVPPKVRRLLERCLEKDPAKRLRDIGDVWMLLDEPPTVAATLWPRHSWLPWTLAGLAVLTAAIVSYLWLRAPITEPLITQFQIEAPTGTEFTNQYGATAISPDGKYVVFGAQKQGGQPLLWLRPLDSLAARPLLGTEGANTPFWSPDSKSVAYYAGGKLKRSDIMGGTPQLLCDAENGGGSGGTWNRDGIILFAEKGELFRVDSSGGMLQQVTALDPARKEYGHGNPQFLPDGRHFLFLDESEDPNIQGIYATSVDDPKQRVRILATGWKAFYVPAATGHTGYLLWMRGQTLLAQPFDAGSLKLQGDPSLLVEDVATNQPPRAAFWASDSGVLAYRSGTVNGATGTLTWLDRKGQTLGKVGKPEGYGELSLSPDGSRVAVFRRDTIGQDLWIVDLARGSSTRLTTDPENESYPVWSPDGDQIAFSSNASGQFDLYRKPSGASGQQELLFKDDSEKRPSDWSRDGRYLLYSANHKGTGWDLWYLPMTGEDRKPVQYLATQFNEGGGVFSPDGRWVAYLSNQSGRDEVYVSPFPDANAQPAMLASTEGARFVRWRRDGKTLLYVTPDYKLTEIEVLPGSTFNVGVPQTLFDVPLMRIGDVDGKPWDVSADGRRFLVNTRAERENVVPLTVLTNWQVRLKK